ncbi:NAD-dependent succinate-semialdehyde dehydrogenase [Dactylosporangium vinaceum]|uniref:NAD-dependent succinate-semialdehyde dehydrogenase n=1 Tax=Dactylosporangium vinaceum TaxID=53362 RepID=A0ABV5M969_9ACTN|nr:NAD-dependent succinate-semialdehyde dehydrogenase [Dactylosporangium vinaceum]UAB99452.1 NAD-dependent succinate-semialdehyde dehydrogenase [Dactylosporangium vinaceum]
MSTSSAVRHSPIATVNPYNNQIVREFPPMSPEAVDDAAQRAHRAFQSWRRAGVDERAAVLARAARLLRERGEELAQLATLEMGKLIRHSRAEMDLSARILQYCADEGPRLLADEPLELDGGSAAVVNDPLGVIAGAQPWNFPVYQVVRFAGPNLVLGNTILLKHASNTPQTALAMERLFADAGIPQGVYTNLLITGSEFDRVVELDVVRGASLTGSERGGASVGAAAGRSTKKSVLELGGSDPFIVLDGDNLGHTVDAAMAGRMHNMGQSCVSAKRMIVLSGAYEGFVTALAQRMRALRPGDPADEATTLAPMSSERAAEKLSDQVRDALDKGAVAVTGGGRIDRPGAFMQPTVLVGVTPAMRAYREELFGPVAVVHEVDSDDDAVALANDSPYGLGGAVFGTDLERARSVADRIDTGMVWINHPTSSEPQLPFGGIKLSGYGRELSSIGFKEFANRKLVVTMPADTPITDALG